MQEDDYDSDTSDEDYVLATDKAHASSSDPDTDDDIEGIPKGKRGKSNLDSAKESMHETTENIVDETKLKEKENLLWADFLNDVDEAPKPTVQKESRLKSDAGSYTKDNCNKPSSNKTQKNFTFQDEKTVKITKIFEFAGEEVRVEEEVAADSKEAQCGLSIEQSNSPKKGIKRAGASGLLDMIENKRTKLSTLEKTKLDWNSFKKSEGLDDELELHKKSKSGYLEKQDFLARTDLKEFEIEKQLRMKNRSKR